VLKAPFCQSSTKQDGLHLEWLPFHNHLINCSIGSAIDDTIEVAEIEKK
jgi:hypothetical protein